MNLVPEVGRFQSSRLSDFDPHLPHIIPLHCLEYCAVTVGLLWDDPCNVGDGSQLWVSFPTIWSLCSQHIMPGSSVRFHLINVSLQFTLPACVASLQSRTYYKQAWHDETLITGYSWEIKAFRSRKEKLPSFMILSQMMTAWNGASCSVSKWWHLWTTVTRPRSSSLLGCEFIYHARTARNLWELSGIYCLWVLLLRKRMYCKFLSSPM